MDHSNHSQPKVLIAMSGGVDSSVAALLLKEQGFSCLGCTMKLYHNEDAGLSHRRTCCALEDVEDARAAAFRMGIPYYVFNFRETFRRDVMEKFARCYENGLTPNPCIDCNHYLKFGKLYERAKILGCDYIATGHYARIENIEGQYVLKKAADLSKDQSYVLYSLTQEQLAHTLFPLGGIQKSQVRQMAREKALTNAEKPDSQDICFVPEGKYASVVERISGRPAVPGDFVDENGKRLGSHQGIIHYTIGQRRGVGISASEPLYVCGISPEKNTVTLGKQTALFRASAEVEQFHWISGNIPPKPISCTAKLRYRQTEQPALAVPTGESTVRLIFEQPQRAVTPGQAAVLYDKDRVLGGGVLSSKVCES